MISIVWSSYCILWGCQYPPWFLKVVMEGGGCILSPIYLGSSILSSRASCILATVKVEMFSGYSFCAQLYYSGSNTKYSTLMNNHFISIKAEKKKPKTSSSLLVHACVYYPWVFQLLRCKPADIFTSASLEIKQNCSGGGLSDVECAGKRKWGNCLMAANVHLEAPAESRSNSFEVTFNFPERAAHR